MRFVELTDALDHVSIVYCFREIIVLREVEFQLGINREELAALALVVAHAVMPKNL